MNQFFSFSRFKLLVLMHWAHNKKRYGLSLLALIGLLIIRFLLFLLIGIDDDKSGDVQKTTYFLSLFVVGTLYASQYFSDLGSRAKASNFLLVPASAFEKVLCALMYTVVLFMVVLTAAYYLIDIMMVAVLKQIVTTEEAGVENVFQVGFFIFRNNLVINGMLFFLAIQSAFLLGSVYFKKYSFLKTIIIGFVAYFFLFGITYMLCKPLFPGDRDQVSIPGRIEQIFGLVLMYVVAPLFWVLTYYRLKAKEV
jgi:hypothetical protein